MLRCDGVTKYFKGLCALQDVSFEVKKGTIKAIIGPNGAGKTTLLNIINGIIRPESGEIIFEGKNLCRLKVHEICNLGIARTFQIVRLFTALEMTVIDNILAGAHKHISPKVSDAFLFRRKLAEKERTTREKAKSIISELGLSGLEEKEASSLSLGNQRLVELARALISDPKILLLDEPASGLNDYEVDNFKTKLLELREKGLTILIVEHNMKLVMDIADEIVVLNFGRKIAEGAPKEVAENEDVIEAYLGRRWARS